MAVTLSDQKVSDNESDSDEEGNFIAFTATAVVDESVVVCQVLKTQVLCIQNSNLYCWHMLFDCRT